MNIVDVNDEVPVFETIYGCVTVTEFHDLRDMVTLVKASDADDPNTPNGRIVFSIIGGNDLGIYICSNNELSYHDNLGILLVLKDHVFNM